MNRIYQGRVTSVEIPKPGTKSEWAPLDPDPKVAKRKGEEALWQHHELFQDAVNYYIVAIASLGVSPDSKLTKLRELLDKVWAVADKKGQLRRGMRESLQRVWQLEQPPTLAEAVEKFTQPLTDDSIPLTTAEKAAEFLLFNLGGESAIQQGGPVFLPMFCDVDSAPTYWLSPERRGRADAEERLQRTLYSELDLTQIRALADTISLGAVVNLQPATSPDVGEAVIERLKQAANTFKDEVEPKAFEGWLKSLPTHFTLPKRRGGNINVRRVDACTLFLAFPNEVTKRLFQSTFSPPKPQRTASPKTPSEAPEVDDSHFVVDGDDPIKLSRGTRGWVFRGFTALPIWNGDGRTLTWKEFDIAAFKEALKVYNQFQQNVQKREEKLDGFATKLLVMDGLRALDGYASETEGDRKLRARLRRVWDDSGGKPKLPTRNDGEEVAISKFIDDPRIDRLRLIINDDLAEEYRLTEGRLTPYGLRRRTMKGWTEVKRRWQSIVRKGTRFSEATRKKLTDELDQLRSGEKREQIGSHRLFEAMLADETVWSIWREPDDKLQEQNNQKGWAADPLEAFREYCETREAFEEISSRPLNFTPADARYSRRLFMFTDACSFGNDGGDYRHDAKHLAVTVPVAVRNDSERIVVQRCRLVYSAPRLLRDRIRAEDGSYSQDWTQPMMRTLFGSTEEKANPQELKDAAVQLMPDYDGTGERRILLNFPLSLEPKPCWEQVYALRNQNALFAVRYGRKDKKQEKPLNGGIWESNVRTFWESDAAKSRDFLYWPTDERKPQVWSKGDWWEKVSSFQVLAADLGTRHAASVALIEAGHVGGGTSRFIGKTGAQNWYARYRAGTILRLPGENAQVLRPKTRLDEDELGKAFREELYGERGRSADEKECLETIQILPALNQPKLLHEFSDAASLRQRFSFPEQNDRLLVAMRWTQKWIALCVSWHWKLTQPDDEQQRETALAQIREHDRKPEWKPLTDGGPESLAALRSGLREHILHQRKIAEESLLQLTKRILPLRGRTWEWVTHPEKSDCRLLRQTQKGTSSEKVKLPGQRGLSIARIEQLSELRRRWQSLNQSLRRELGEKPLTASEMRNDPIPDPCPDILRKLENIREQRVNQTAHLILAQALGLKLKEPEISPERRRVTDTHGEYAVVRPPVDLIVLEDLSRYLSDQGRAKSENTRLMKWCHRAITLKVKMLAEPFGLPVLETPAAYSSRFCSLTGAAGFRAAEVGWKDRHEFRWRILLEEFAEARAEKTEPSANARFADELFRELENISGSDRPHLTLLAPQPGGPMFVTAREVPHPSPSPEQKQKTGGVLPMQADLNAAANLAFRAVAHPACADIHHRVRTQRKAGTKSKAELFQTRETRRFGKEGAAIILHPGHELPKDRNSNLFFDPHGVAEFGRAKLETDSGSEFLYASGPGLWKLVNKREAQWERCMEINRARIAKWNRDTSIPNHPEL